VLDPADILAADRDARARGIDIVGYWHSHPDHPAHPSQFDTDHAWVDYVYVICATTSEGTGDVNAFTLTAEGGPFEHLLLVGASPWWTRRGLTHDHDVTSPATWRRWRAGRRSRLGSPSRRPTSAASCSTSATV